MNQPTNLLHSNASLLEYQKSIDSFILSKNSKLSNKELWDQYYIVKSNVHPETKQPIPI